ncbi:MAG: transposase [Thermodesulfovibrionia bacterium]|nr:transposase [Thermodesulfovibrionia bacterium]
MKNPSSYLQMRVLGAIDSAPGKTIRQRTIHVAGLTFTDEEGNPRQFTWRTIQTWRSRYLKNGITSMGTAERSDKGKARKVSPEELMEAINSALPHFMEGNYNKSDIYRFCIEKGFLSKDRISATTFYRFIREYDLLDSKQADDKKRLAFSMQYANELWQADTMYGPFVQDGSKGKRRTYLIAFIDDASRVLCHGQFFFEENVDSMVKALRSAFYKRGIPQQLYVDNGAIYCSAEITLICARIGCVLRHAPVRDGAAKGKIEKFFRRVRQQFLNRVLNLSTLEILNRQFTDYVEGQYNTTVHSAIGMKPIDRFGMDLKHVRFLPPSEVNDELFFAEETRKVKKDNTFSFKNIRYETPVDLRDKIITVRYERSRRDRIIIYYKNQRMGQARKLDLIANGKIKRRKDEK